MTAKRAIGIGFLIASAIGLLTLGLKTGSFKKENLFHTTTPLNHKREKIIKVDADTTITDLTDYTWYANNTLDFWAGDPNQDLDGVDIDITFESNNTIFTRMDIWYSADEYLSYDNPSASLSIEVYSLQYVDPTLQGWQDPAYKQVHFLGGDAKSNTLLINFLQVNGSLVYNGEIIPPDGPETGNFTSLQELMLQILTMPFTFITQAFNVTLWPNTPYQFNISNFIMGLIAIATIIFIIKLFTSGFSVVGNYTGKVQNQKLTNQKIKESKSKTDLNNRTNPNKKD